MKKILIIISSIILMFSTILFADSDDSTVVVISTDKGDITIELYLAGAPITAGNFLMLVEQDYYDGLIFHRVEEDYVIQGGDPLGTGMGGPGYTIPDEPTKYNHIKGAVGMAKTPEPHSAGSQFYICLDKLKQLDGKYTIFGQVIEGMDVVKKIKIGDVINEIYIKEKGIFDGYREE